MGVELAITARLSLSIFMFLLMHRLSGRHYTNRFFMRFCVKSSIGTQAEVSLL